MFVFYWLCWAWLPMLEKLWPLLLRGPGRLAAGKPWAGGLLCGWTSMGLVVYWLSVPMVWFRITFGFWFWSSATADIGYGKSWKLLNSFRLE